MKVFLDANIFFSAATPSSATHRLLKAVVRYATAFTSPHAWEEARRNLEIKRPTQLDGLEALRPFLTMTHAFVLPLPIQLPACDQPILAAALGARCSHLWTGDQRHFGPHYGATIGGLRIVSRVMLADELADKSVMP